MEGKKTRSRALLVFGAPCSGKTTFGKNFSKKFGLAYFDLDEIKEQYRLTYKNILLIVFNAYGQRLLNQCIVECTSFRNNNLMWCILGDNLKKKKKTLVDS